MSTNGGYPGIPDEQDGDTTPGLRPLAALLRHAERESLEVFVMDGAAFRGFGWKLADRASTLEERRRHGRGGLAAIPNYVPWLGPAPREDEVDRAPRAPRPAADDCGYEIGGEGA